MEHDHSSAWWGHYLAARTSGRSNIAAQHQAAAQLREPAGACTWEADCPASTHLPACPALPKETPQRPSTPTIFRRGSSLSSTPDIT